MLKINNALFVIGLLTGVNALPKIQNGIYSNRIVGGQDAIQGDLPYQISLRYNGTHICGGALVNLKGQQAILTAAHCVDPITARPYTVTAGDLDRLDDSGFEQTRQVIRVIPHEDYNLWSHAYDIAILLIEFPFDINTNVQPIALPESRQETTGQVVISGWGSSSVNGSLSNVLQYVLIPVVEYDTCNDAYRFEHIYETMLCTGLFGEGGIDSCEGDTGGPVRAVEGNYLAGIVANWDYGCADGRYPHVNTKVSYFIEWMNDQI